MGEAPEHPTVVGIPEIARRLGVKRATIDQWKWLGQFPPPKWTVGGRPAWDMRDVQKWFDKRAKTQK